MSNFFAKGHALSSFIATFQTMQSLGRMEGITGFAESIKNLGYAFTKTTGFTTTFLASMAKVAGVAVLAGVAIYGLYKYVNRFNDAVETASESQDTYLSTVNELRTLQSELETTQSKIAELESMDSLTLTEEADLERLRLENAELERQIALKQQEADIANKQALEDAMQALTMEATADTTKGTVSTPFIFDTSLNPYGTTAEQYQSTTVVEATANEIEKLRNLKEEYNQLLLDDPTSERLSSLESEIEVYEAKILTQINSINTLRESFLNSDGALKDGLTAEQNKMYETVTSVIDSWNNIVLTPAEQALKKIESFFNTKAGSTIEKELQGAADTTTELKTKLQSMGLTLEDIGVDTIAELQQYFKDTANAVDNATAAVERFNGVSVADVEGAFDSDNAGKDYETMLGLLDQAQEIYENGLIGTDDFQTSAQFLLPHEISTKGYKYDAIAYKEAWEKTYKMVKDWFDEDNPVKSMWNFTDDLYSKAPEFFDIYNKGTGEIEFNTKNFESSADAAEKLGISVQLVETVLKRLKDYGFEFDEDFKWSGEQLAEYSSNLEGIRDIYDSLSDGTAKNRLGKLLEGWDEEYAGFQEDLTSLDDKYIIDIEFEYSLAQLEQEIDELQRLANEGDSTALSALNAKKSEKVDTLEKKNKYKADDTYKASDVKITELQGQFSDETLTSAQKDAIKEQIGAIYDLKGAYQEFLRDGGKLNWADYLNSDQATDVLSEISKETGLTVDELSKLVGLEVTKVPIEIEGKVNSEEIQQQINELENGGTLIYTADVQGVEATIEAVKNEEGNVTYTADINGVKVELDESGVKTVNGTISYTLDEESIKTILTKMSEGGNVDLTNRPKVDSSTMQNAGYDVEDGSYSTVDTHTFSNPEETIAMNFTPILPDGTVMEKSAFEQYCEDVIAGAEDIKGLKIGVTYEGEDAIDQATKDAETIHVLHESLFEDDIVREITIDSEATVEEAYKIRDALAVIPTEVMTELIANDQASDEILKVISETFRIPEETLIEINATDGSTGVITYVLSALTSIPYERMTELLAIDSASGTAATVQGNIEQVEREPNTEFTATDAGASNVAQTVGTAVKDVPLTRTTTFGGTVASSFTNAYNKIKNALAELGGSSNLEGTAHLSGSMGGLYPIPKLSGRALAMGTLQDNGWLRPDWKTSNSEVALTGELGQELVVKGNRWWTVGDHGAEFTAIPQGSVVFNASQTKELFKKGYINSRGTAHLSGTAFNTGGFLPTPANNYKYAELAGASSGNSTTTKNNNNNTNNNNDNSSSDEFKESLDLIEKKIDRIERGIDKLDTTVNATYKSWSERNQALLDEIDAINNEIAIQQQAYNRYIQEANSVGLDESWAQKVREGKVDIETITDEDLNEKISQYQEWYEKALDCQQVIIDLHDNVAELAQQVFDNVATQFEDELSIIERQTESIENAIDRVESRGYIVASSMYTALAASQQSELMKRQAELKALKAALDEAMALGDIKEFSETWYEMMGNIMDVESEIEDLNSALIETNNALRDLEWDTFDRLQDMLSTIQSEADFLIELMSNQKLVNDDGTFTNEGLSSLGLHTVNYNAYMSQADEYAKEIAEITQELANDPNNTVLYDRRAELIEQQREMIQAAEDEKEAIKDLYEESYNALLDSMNELIDKRKEYLQAIKDQYDFEKEVAKQVKEIANLEKQLRALQGDTSEENRATIQQIKVKLDEAKENLEETEYDKYISDQEQMLDKMYDETEQWINERLDNLELLLQSAIETTNESGSLIRETLINQSESIGATLSEEMKIIWGADGIFTTIVAGYAENFGSLLTTTNLALDKIRLYLAKMAGEDESKDTNANGTPAPTPEPTPTPSTTNNNNTENKTENKNSITVGGKINAGSAPIYDYAGDTSGEKQYYSNDPIYTVIKEQNGYLLTRYHKLSSGYTGWFKKSDVKAYAQGGLNEETGLAWLDGTKSEPEMVLNPTDTQNMLEIVDSLRQISNADLNSFKNFTNSINLATDFMNNVKGIQSTLMNSSTIAPTQTVSIGFGDIHLHEVNDADSLHREIVSILLNNQRVRKIIQEDTLGAVYGQNSLNRFKYSRYLK